ncbi:MAG: 50S ribosomal protein L1 [Deltaproteobacteria bacterium]|nr:50S ribosomal protein L1 [Deltaproteobacteria bacterium]
MGQAGKKYRAALEKVDREKRYPLEEACVLLSGLKIAKFDESVDVSINLGVDPKQSDQQVRGAAVLPHGLGKTIRVLVIAKGDKADEAKAAGALEVGDEALIEKIAGGWLEFDKLVATPDMMAKVSKLGKILGPRGLMPNPKLGTVTFEVAKAVKELQSGKVEFRVDKAGIVHASIGRLSFGAEKIQDNIKVLIDALVRLKPPTSKGIYLKSMVLSSTMGPGIRIDSQGLQA